MLHSSALCWIILICHGMFPMVVTWQLLQEYWGKIVAGVCWLLVISLESQCCLWTSCHNTHIYDNCVKVIHRFNADEVTVMMSKVPSEPQRIQKGYFISGRILMFWDKSSVAIYLLKTTASILQKFLLPCPTGEPGNGGNFCPSCKESIV